MNTATRTRMIAGLAATLVASFGLSACGSGSSSESVSADTQPASTATSGCGSLPGALPTDTDGALAALAADLQTPYQGTTAAVSKSAWAETKPTAGPWKIGYTALPSGNAINNGYLAEFKKRFAEAKTQGLVTGDLELQILPDPTSMTPAQQIQAYQSLVRSGVNGILMQPLSAPAMADVVTEAGKKGVVTGSFNPINSPYAVSTQVSFYQDAGVPAAAILKQLGGKGNVLVVRGIAGVAPDTDGYAAIEAALSQCSDVKVVGQVNAAFTDSSAKSAVQTYLASHPGQIDAVLTTGGMSTGTLNAFQAAGRKIPLITGNGGTAGYYAYWNKNKASYSTAGSVGSPAEQADAVWDSLIRTLAGNGPKINVIEPAATLINTENVADFAVDGEGESSSKTVNPVASAPYLAPEDLDKFFTTPGQPDQKK